MSRTQRAFVATGGVLVLAAGITVGTASFAQAAAAQGPCDIYAAGGTPCVAAHSTTRALFGAYDGPLYQVERASDDTTEDIGVLSPGGYADAAAQDAFCAGTTCVITTVYDQSGEGNDLTQAPAGGAANTPDNLANATAAPVEVNGHEAYGVYVAPGTGYRNNNTKGIATGDDPEGMYAVMDGTHYNGGCCFDYGNAETDSHDDGNGTMEAIYFGNIKVWGYGSGTGPWIMADQENGLFSGENVGYNTNDPSIDDRFVTAIVKGESDHWAIRGGDAQSGDLSTFYDGPRPDASGYNPMKKQGAIILGIGGDNSKGSAGTFYEGVMTSGYPSDATEDAVQANIDATTYTAVQVPLDPGPQVSLKLAGSGDSAQYATHDDSDDGVSVAALPADATTKQKQDATWVETAGLANSSCVSFESVDKPGEYLRHQNFQFHLMDNDGSSLFANDATFCPATGNSGQGVSFKSVNYTTKYIRAYNGKLDLASDGGSNAWDTDTGWASDSSWTVDSPLGSTVPAATAGEQIRTTVTQQGGLTMSADGSSPVVLPTPTLTDDASALASSGDINPVTVTDTRQDSPGWNVTGQVSAFSDGSGDTIAAGSLGWTPKVIDSSTGQSVTPGPVVAPNTGGGLGSSQQLASAAAGTGARGTAHLGATLDLQAPTTTEPGTYTATLTLTAI